MARHAHGLPPATPAGLAGLGPGEEAGDRSGPAPPGGEQDEAGSVLSWGVWQDLGATSVTGHQGKARAACLSPESPEVYLFYYEGSETSASARREHALPI